MKIGTFDTASKVLVIAEIGQNHEGSLAAAKELIAAAAEAGADAVKFQTFKTDLFVSPRDVERFERMKRFELGVDDWRDLAETSRAAGLLFISTPLDLFSQRLLLPLVDCYKIASGDNTFYPLIQAVAETGLPIIISSGFADLEIIGRARQEVVTIWNERELPHELGLLHCVSSYPALAEDLNLAAIWTMRQHFEETIGYSDHSIGTQAAAAAVAAGARIIEKHFTLSKTHSDFRDHQLSAEPDEFAEMMDIIRRTELVLGHGQKVPTASETEQVGAVRRSIAVVRDLGAGHTIKYEDLIWLRPGDGLAPGQEDLVVGKRLLRDVRCGDRIEPSDLTTPTT